MPLDTSFDMARFGEFSDFVAKFYRPDLALRDQKLFEWQFMSKNGVANLATYNENGKILGILGYVPVKMFWGDFEPKNGVFFMNWAVDKEAAPGVGFAMLRYLIKNYQLVLSSSPSEENLKITSELGWEYIEHIPRMLYFFDDKLRDTVEPESRLDFALYSPAYDKYSCFRYSIVKDAKYLKWRYEDHPYIKYEILSNNEQNPIVLVYRIIEAFDDKGRFLVAKISEFFFPDGDKAKAKDFLLKNINAIKAKNVKICEFVCADDNINSIFVDVGFCKEEKDRELFPKKMTPLKNETKNYSLQYFDKMYSAKPDRGEIYYTLADGDDDRISSINLLKVING